MSAPPPDAILTVTELTRDVKGLLGSTWGDVWVQGEISQPRRAGSGHVYLTLKDAGAVLPAVLWRSTVHRLRFHPEEGQEVLALGGLDVYPPHGRYQLIIRRLEPVGVGALQLAFEQLKQRLEDEGLFAVERKVALPAFPRRIVLITSPTGAAVRDMVTVIHRRLPGAKLLLVPVRVQGEGAAREIADALRFADTRADADAIVVGRGGGSLEDLWAFNEEVTARAISACLTPVVSAVGHETDVTIADLVADVRAATPSQAGELVTPDRAELYARLDALRGRLERRARSVVDMAWQQVESRAEHPAFRDPPALLRPWRQRVDHLAARLAAGSPVAELRRRAEAVAALAPRLAPPVRRRLRDGREQVDLLAQRLLAAPRWRHERWTERLRACEGRLTALSPLAVLGRGYSLTTLADGRVLRRAADVGAGDVLTTRLADGAHVESEVVEVRPGGGEDM